MARLTQDSLGHYPGDMSTISIYLKGIRPGQGLVSTEVGERPSRSGSVTSDARLVPVLVFSYQILLNKASRIYIKMQLSQHSTP